MVGLASDRKVKCLLVDDRPENLIALAALLRSAEVEVLTAASGREALELALAHDLALALLDVQMPEMDGFELAELLRGSERTRQVPIIFVTAGVRDHQRLFKGYDSGAVDFLYKPVEGHILKSKAEVFFDLYRTKRRLSKELEERTETLRVREVFSAVLGHDLRTPLSAIQLAAVYIKRMSDDAKLKDKAEQIITSGKRMSRMISDLLDLSRIQMSQGIPVMPMPSDARALMQTVVAELAAPAGALETHFQGDTAGCWDPDRFSQLMHNLLGNALQYGQAGQPVQVTVDGRAEDTLVIDVRNLGVIAPALLPHIFKPFHARSETSNTRDGLGLGLFIVHEIARAHGGSVAVRAENGNSTVFSVRLPRQAAWAVRKTGLTPISPGALGL